MNIFATHRMPQVAARNLCDQHIIKMCLETAQILSTVLRKKYGDSVAGSDTPWSSPALYRSTHHNHPCTLWAESEFNFAWLCDHGIAIGEEYTRRYKKIHRSSLVIAYAATFKTTKEAGWCWATPPPLSMPDEFKHCTNKTADWKDVVISYRRYYEYKSRVLSRFTYTNCPRPKFLGGEAPLALLETNPRQP